MTLIAFHANHDAVDVLTDTLSYTLHGNHIRRVSKVRAFPHLDTVMMGHGACRLATAWAAQVETDAPETFDELEELAGAELGYVADDLDLDSDVDAAAVFHVGWSPAAGRFVASRYQLSTGFEREDFTGAFFAIPSPSPGVITAIPATVDEWRALGRAVRDDVAPRRDGQGSVPVGGELHLTHLERGSVSTRLVHRFTEAEFIETVRDTLHPIGQRSPCGCGSGLPHALCHLGLEPDDDCRCGSGLIFDDCCRVPVELPGPGSPAFAAAKVGRNDPCPCGSGRKSKTCCARAA